MTLTWQVFPYFHFAHHAMFVQLRLQMRTRLVWRFVAKPLPTRTLDVFQLQWFCHLLEVVVAQLCIHHHLQKRFSQFRKFGKECDLLRPVAVDTVHLYSIDLRCCSILAFPSQGFTCDSLFHRAGAILCWFATRDRCSCLRCRLISMRTLRLVNILGMLS